MNNRILHLILSFLFAMYVFPTTAGDVEKAISVHNPSATDRREVVEVAECPDGNFRLCDSEGKEIQYQVTYDGKLIFMAEVPAGGATEYFIKEGIPSVFAPKCYGRVFPERADDLAWENDRAAYRAYGPALQRSGEKAYGYDIWCKSVPYTVLEQRFYDHNHLGISFHEDHGKGMDVYGVGPTLGGGTSAILAPGDSIIYPYCWAEAEILDNGPLRFTARLTYHPTVIGGDTIIERRVISLEAGSWLNKTTVTYEGLKGDLRPMAGIVVHEANPKGYAMLDGIVIYTDLTQDPSNGNGEIYVAMLGDGENAECRYLPLPEKSGDATGHICLIGKPGCDTFAYWWGSGWSKGGVKNSDDWTSMMRELRENLQNPLILERSCSRKELGSGEALQALKQLTTDNRQLNFISW